MTNLRQNLESLKYTMENNTIRKAVIQWAGNQGDADLNILFNQLMQYGCQSGMVTDLIYYRDTVDFFDNHQQEIEELLEQLGIEDLESYNGMEELAEMFGTPTPEERDEELLEELREEAEDNLAEEIEDWEDLEEEEQQELIFEELDRLAMYENPFGLTVQDKNNLAWWAFEVVASIVYDELLEIEAVI